jgi:hypothetical protein
MRPTRHATIHGHVVEEFHWHDCPICYVDAHRVAGSFDHAVADLRAAGRFLLAVQSQTARRQFGGDNLKTGSPEA